MIKPRLTRSSSAVIVLDTQRLFTAPDGPFANAEAQETIAALNPFLAGCRDRAVPVVLCNYMLRADGSDAGLLGELDFVRQGLLNDDSPWVALDDRVARDPADIEVRHPRPSGFFASDPDLEELLRARGVETAILCGFSVNNAISATARDAFARDIASVVVRDCTGAAPFEPADELDAAYNILERWTAEVTSSDDVLARLDRA